MRIKELEIEDFRHIKNQKIEFGKRLTIISGQNGTGKSSILGWIAQLCDFKKKNKRLNEEYYKEDFSNVFMFCPINDYDKNYKIKFTFKDEASLIEENKIITTRLLQQTEKSKLRYRTDFDSRGKALNFPVISSGLKRLIPFATREMSKLRARMSLKNISTHFLNYQKKSYY